MTVAQQADVPPMMAPTALPGPRVRSDAALIVETEGWAAVARWALGAVQILGVGLLVPIAILAVGTPIVLTVRLVLWIFGAT